ncbi:MAG: hypothetical protein RIB71_05545 [Imperialibacter sp.]|uniref:hypothetical protein n=1 Tax=Imperialibacter sp. TaxID=2038411 RepID=UPI0032ED022D
MIRYFAVAGLLGLMTKVSFVYSQSADGDRYIESALSVQSLNSWQTEIALKESKSISDYFLLLPKQLLEQEVELENDTKEFRLASAREGRGRINVSAGYLEAKPDVNLMMALFKNRADKGDIIAIAIGCGVPPVQLCDYGFMEFDSQSKRWTFSDVFPWTEFYEKCETIKADRSKLTGSMEPFVPNIVLPEVGTTIYVIDAWDTKKEPVFRMVWNGTRFDVE